MCNNIFSACLSILFLLLLTLSGRAEDSSSKSDPPQEVHTLQIQGMELKGEEIDYKIQQGGEHEISLRGQAKIQIDEIVVTADVIHATYSKKENAVIDLKGQVKIVSPADSLRANCLEAKFDLTERSLTLKGNAEDSARLSRYHGSKVTELVATEIQFQFSYQDAVLIKTSGPVEISERKQTKADDFLVLPVVRI